MALDHYVSQVHLKNFYSPELGDKMHAIRKRDQLQFICGAKDVCRIEENSTNSYLVHDRAIEDFLLNVEPSYNRAVTTLRDGTIDADTVFVIAGFIAYVATCSPAGMRIQSEPLQRSVQATAAILDAAGRLGRAPESLGNKTLTELIEGGMVNVAIDPKYPQALGIADIQTLMTRLGNATWEILLNEDPASQFLTSDYPVALETMSDPAMIHRLVPLTPSVAVRIIPNVPVNWEKVGAGFPMFRYVRRYPDHAAIRALNTAIVQCAETTVFYRHQQNWMKRFVAKNSSYRIEAVTERLPGRKSQVLLTTQKIVRQLGDKAS